MSTSNLTKNALADALVRLLENRRLEKITIRDITDECRMTRNTFYYHFDDIYDILAFIFRNQADRILEEFSGKDDWKGVFESILDYLYQNREMINNIFYSVRNENLEVYIKHVVEIYACRIIEIKTGDMDAAGRVKKTVADFYSNAFVGATFQWVREGMKVTPHVMAILYDSMFQGTLNGAMESARKVLEEQEL